MIFGIYLLGFLLVPILAPYVIIFGRLDIILKNSRTSFYLFYSFSFNFIVLRSRATSIWYQSINSIRDQVIIFVLRQKQIRSVRDIKSNHDR